MMDRKERILAFMREDAYKPLLFSELVTVLDVPKATSGCLKPAKGAGGRRAHI